MCDVVGEGLPLALNKLRLDAMPEAVDCVTCILVGSQYTMQLFQVRRSEWALVADELIKPFDRSMLILDDCDDKFR